MRRRTSSDESRRYALNELWIRDGGWTTHDDDWLRLHVAHALSKIPAEDADLTLDKCIFLMPRKSEEGQYIKSKFVRGKDLILFPESLTEQPEAIVIGTILHEVAHFLLKHKSQLLEGLSLDEWRKQEREAEMLVDRWTKRKSR